MERLTPGWRQYCNELGFLWVGSTPVLWLVLCAKILALYHGLHNRVKFTSAQLEQFCTGMPLCCNRLHLNSACCCMGYLNTEWIIDPRLAPMVH
jgi:hypothetical protein